MSDGESVVFSTRTKFAYATFTTLLILSCVELGARAAGFGRRVVTVPDARVGFRLVPNQVRTTPRGQHILINSHGMRDEEFPRQKPAGEYRVLLLGDSLTFGIDVEQDEIFAQRLHRSLANRHGGKVRVMNGAVQGYDSSNERDWLYTFGFDFEPDLVVVMFYPNDIEFTERKLFQNEFPGRDLLRRTATFEWLESGHIARQSQQLGQSGEAASLREQQRQELIRKYVGTASWNPNDPADKQNTILAEKILIEMAQRCAQRKVKFAVALLPGFANTRDPKLPNIMGGMAWTLGEKQIPVVNLHSVLVPHHPACWLPWDEGHLSASGHEVIANALESWLAAPEGELLPPRPE
jgi:lysophospholipase L1-like esterase